MAIPGWSAAPPISEVVFHPLPVSHTGRYEDGGEDVVTPLPEGAGQVDAVVRGNAAGLFEGWTGSEGRGFAILLVKQDAYAAVLVDGFELPAIGWEMNTQVEVATFTQCERPVSGSWDQQDRLPEEVYL